MQLSQEQIFAVKKQLQDQMNEYQQKLEAVLEKQKKLKKIEDIAQSILDYNEIERQITDRAHLFSLFFSPPESLTSPYVKSQLFSYFEAAETIGPQMVDFLVDDFLMQLRNELQSSVADNYDSADLIQAEFKEYIIPGKIIAEKFEQIDSLIEEMNQYCQKIDPHYDPMKPPNSAFDVLRYAFEISITADTRMDPTVHAIKEIPFRYLTHEDRIALLGAVDEHLAVIRFEKTKEQNIAMDMAVHMLAQKEQQEEGPQSVV